MTKTVWKYTIDINDTLDPVLEIPGGGRFLTLKDQNINPSGLENEPGSGIFDTWWAVDTEKVPVEVQLYITGTGFTVPDNVDYLGTIFPMANLVLHVWQKIRDIGDLHIVDGKFVPRSQ